MTKNLLWPLTTILLTTSRKNSTMNSMISMTSPSCSKKSLELSRASSGKNSKNLPDNNPTFKTFWTCPKSKLLDNPKNNHQTKKNKKSIKTPLKTKIQSPAPSNKNNKSWRQTLLLYKNWQEREPSSSKNCKNGKKSNKEFPTLPPKSSPSNKSLFTTWGRNKCSKDVNSPGGPSETYSLSSANDLFSTNYQIEIHI